MPSPLVLHALLLAACTPESGPPAVPEEEAETLVLSEEPLAELEVPDNSRPEGAEPPTEIPVVGPWRYVGTSRAGMHKYATAVPIRPRGLFFNKPQPGLELHDAQGRTIDYDRFGKKQKPMWSHDRKELIVYQAERNPPPSDDAFTLVYPKAVEREAALNLQFSEHADDPGSFVWKTIQDDWDSRRGLLLPAPGVASWDIEVPAAAELHFTSGLVEPELRDADGSDGATLIVEVEANGEIKQVHSSDLAIRSFTPQRIDLSEWQGKPVRLRIRTEPKANTTFDYAFIAEPVVASRKANPRTVVMVFIDTLRPDHMSLYGYERDTTAGLDPLLADAAVFTNARSVAPWTLPSARTIVTGRHPEFYDRTETLQETLRKEGYATAFMAGNVYLSTNFGMARDWEMHRVGLWPIAQKVTDDTLEWLDQHDGRDSLIQIHYMDPHLPYLEPSSYRSLYAGDGPDKLREEFHLPDVRRANLQDDPDGQQYIRDRYDNNVRYATDQIARIVEKLDDNDILVLYADHGEEFWEHTGFEHGHTLFDELLKVPLVVKAPGMKAGRFDEPTSLLDITPTILDLAGVEPAGTVDGTSLVPLASGTAGASETFTSRDLAFGRPLYGMERWGVLHGQEKWSTSEGREAMYDLATDPDEKNNLFRELPGDPGAEFRDHLAGALGRGVGVGYRLTPTPHKGKPVPGLWALCTVPGGFETAWKADDPLMNSEATVRLVDAEEARKQLEAYQVEGHEVPDDTQSVEVCWHPGKFGSREIYMVPVQPMAEVGMQMVCSGYMGDANGGRRGSMSIAPNRQPGLSALRTPLQRMAFDTFGVEDKHPVNRSLMIQYGIGPMPTDETQELSGADPEMREMLEATGYADPDAPEDAGDQPQSTTCEPPAVELQAFFPPEDEEKKTP